MQKHLCAGVALVAMLATGCVIEPAPIGPTGIVVNGPPPQPMQESRPPPVQPRAIWIPGYWHWTGMQYAWIPGHWEDAAPGAHWRSPRYFLRDGVYYYEPGQWLPPAH